jgi:hypothetical protein
MIPKINVEFRPAITFSQKTIAQLEKLKTTIDVDNILTSYCSGSTRLACNGTRPICLSKSV